MLRQIAISFIFLLLLTGCGKKETERKDQNRMIVYSYYSNLQDDIDTFDVLIENRDSVTYYYKSKDPEDTKWSYELKIKIEDSVKVTSEGDWNKKGEVYKAIDRRGVKLYFYGNRYYFVYKILHYSYAIDSQGLTFWSPEFGIILARSLTWPSFVRYEYLNDEFKNQIIRHLAFSIITDKQFYNEPDWESYLIKHNP